MGEAAMTLKNIGVFVDGTPEGEKRIDYAATLAEQCGADGYIKKGDFMRFREASVNYVLPDKVLRLLRSPAGSVVLTGRNLSTLSTKYPGMDPEDGGFSTESNWTPPPLRYWIARVNLSY